MKKQTLENTLKFLQRTELKWWEVPAFIECINLINEYINNESLTDSDNNNLLKED